MWEKKKHFSQEFEDEYDYYRVPLSSGQEFKVLTKALKSNAAKGKAMPVEVVNRFFTLLENVRLAEQRYYESFIEKSTEKVNEYFKKKKKYYFENVQYYFDPAEQKVVNGTKFKKTNLVVLNTPNFKDMIEFVIGNLLHLDRKIKLDKDTCMYYSFLLLSCYRTPILSRIFPKQMEPYNFTVIAGYIANAVFQFPIVASSTSDDGGHLHLTTPECHQAGKYQAKLFTKNFKMEFGEVPVCNLPLSIIFEKLGKN